MIYFEVICFLVGMILGAILCDLISGSAQIKNSFPKRKMVLCYLMSGLYMGCAFWCMSHNFCQEPENLILSVGLVFLAVYAIQDMIELAVYKFLLDIGTVMIVMLRSTVFILDCDFVKLFSFLVLSAAVFVGLKAVSRVIPSVMGCGDYDILFVVYVLCGSDGILQVLFASSVIGILIYVPKLLLKHIKKDEKIPLAPILYLGTLAYFAL